MGDQSNVDGSSNIGADGDKKRPKPGILRLDITKPRRSSGGSVEFRFQPELLGEPPSPNSVPTTGATSPPQLSVTWASACDSDEPDSINSQMQNHLRSPSDKSRRLSKESNEYNFASPLEQSGEINSEDEDYSISVSAIMQRRASIRGRKKGYRSPRRTSSPMDHVLGPGGFIADRRRSSVYTTSSGETAISMEDGTNQDSTQEQIYENIRLHKEVLQSVKFQPWSMKRKLRLVRQAKSYVAKHEGVLQERFAMSRSTKDLWARFKILMAARWQHYKRELKNFSTVLIPWEVRIKEIESHFGSVVASYFTFLRWLLWVNIVISVVLAVFVIIPELLAYDKSKQDDRKKPTDGEEKIADNIMTLWDFEGRLKYSPIFYGYYSNYSGAIRWGYNLPLAYFLTGLVVYVYSFVAILRKMAENSRSSKLSSKDDECVFSWKLFTGWDFMIGHAETAHNRISSVVLGFKEALLEEAEKKKDKRNWKVIVIRGLINIIVTALLAASAYAVVWVVDRSERPEAKHGTWWQRNEINIVMNIIQLCLPFIFDVLGVFERRHPRQSLRLQLGRIMILNLLSLYSLMFALIYKINKKSDRLEGFRTVVNELEAQKLEIKDLIENMPTDFMKIPGTIFTTITDSVTKPFPDDEIEFSNIETETYCYNITVDCIKSNTTYLNTSTLTTLLLLTTTTLLPDFNSNSSTTMFSDYNLSTTDYPDSWYNMNSNESNEINLPNLDDIENVHSTDNWEYYELFEKSDDNILTENPKLALDDSKIRTKRMVHNVATRNEILSNDARVNQIYKEIQEIYRNKTEEILKEIELNQFKVNLTTTTTTISNPIEITSTSTPINDIISTTIDYEEDIIYNSSTTINSDVTDVTDVTTDVTTNIVDTGNYDYEDEDDLYLNETCYEVICKDINVTKIMTNYNESIDKTTSMDPYSTLNMIVSTLSPNDTTTIMNLENSTKFSYFKNLPPSEYANTSSRINKTLTKAKNHLADLCWETMLGQEIARVVMADLVMTVLTPLLMDFLRALVVRYMNDYWCWDLEKKFPQYGDFKVAENILHLVYSQGQIWLGMFFSPGLVIINLVKLIIVMYIRSWIVLTCNVPHEVVFRASKSNNFYLTLLLAMLFLCVLPVSYAVVWLRTSWHCGPYSEYSRISEFFTNTTRNALPKTLHKPLEYITSSSTVIPLLVLLILIIYYLISLTGSLRESNQDLKTQLQKERIEERKKMLNLPETKPTEPAANSITTRWRKVLEAPSPTTPTEPGGAQIEIDESKIQARKELLARIMKKALRKSSATSEDDSMPVHCYEEDETDTEHHDSLPHDEEMKKDKRPTQHSFRRTRKPSLIDIVQLARKDSINEAHPKGRFKIDRNVVENLENDEDPNEKIISERRKSLLRRQNQIPEKDDPNSNYEIVNEKNKEVEKKSKLKTVPIAEPEIFTFDEKTLPKMEKSKDGETSTMKKKKPETISKPTTPTIIPDKKDSTATTSGLSLGRKKFSSFLALVKEAVNAKKQEESIDEIKPEPEIEQNEPKRAESKSDSKSDSKPEQSDMSFTSESMDSGNVEDPRQSGPTSRRESYRKYRKDRPQKRQDSQGSIWSDNIPVITISKTESDECIAECSDKDEKEDLSKSKK